MVLIDDYVPIKLQEELSKGWKQTCSFIFKSEIGELSEYSDWLREYMPQIGIRKSYVSQKDAVFDVDDYCKEARFVIQEEAKEQKTDPLSINEVKDIDSIVRAVSEKWEYIGNKTYGTSSFIEASDIVGSSKYIKDSINVKYSSHIASSSMLWGGTKYLFGCTWVEKGEFAIRIFSGYNIRRCFESSFIIESSDLYFCHNCSGCHDLLFSFNQLNKRYCIGNLQLTKEKYENLRTKLMGEVKEELQKSKKYPALFELVQNESPSSDLKVELKPPVPFSMDPIEKAFSSTTKLLLKKELTGVKQYREWLNRHMPKVEGSIAPFGPKTYIPEAKGISMILNKVPKKRAVTFGAALELGKLRMNEVDISSIKDITEKLSEIGYFTIEMYDNRNTNIRRCPIAFSSSNIYSMWDVHECVNSAVGITTSKCKFVFGSKNNALCYFCINCYHSNNLNRCFEVDMSANCSDTYFSHNCYALNDCMFCFNANAKKNAIGNTELAKEKYDGIKANLLEQMHGELERDKSLKWDIYNIGCYKK